MHFVLKTLKDLQQKDISLFNSLEIFSQVTTNVNQLPFDLGNTIKERYEYIIDKNIGLGFLKKVGIYLRQGNSLEDTELTADMLQCLKFAPITSCEVERSFSLYKEILSDRRKNLSEENIAKYLVIQDHKNLPPSIF